ncbi:glycosyltransferase family 2 protein [Tellurirhabdus rosea]|uniref:glycosyltransferase family 2 protein n=1 Tax=Tellurirhabdus rosea TaxID=2674997 RepID=UPI00225B5A9C|nr:glycosyltransferase family 2 protein [Tellurirhabdus rosea]
MDLSIIIVNYKTPQLIIDCLTSVRKFTSGLTYEVLVVDNESGDQSRNLVLSHFPEVRWIDMGYNSGFARANNRGIDEARGRLILLLNSDTLLVDNVLKRCADVLDNQPDVAAVGPMQINRHGKVHYDLYHGFNQIRKFFFVLPPTPFFDRLLEFFMPERKYADPNQVDWLTGSFVMTRRTVIDKAGKLDPDFFMYGEDVEWGWRLWKQGRILLLRDAFYVHLEYGSSPEYQQAQMSWINRFKPQMQVSNLLWVRKSYGVGAYLILILHYLTMVPIIYAWKIVMNLRRSGRPFSELERQHEFTRKVRLFLRFFWPTLLKKPGFYKL